MSEVASSRGRSKKAMNTTSTTNTGHNTNPDAGPPTKKLRLETPSDADQPVPLPASKTDIVDGTTADPAPQQTPESLPKPATNEQASTTISQPAKKPRMDPTTRRVQRPPQYEDVWLDVYLSGTEWEQQRDVHKYDWDFTHLDEALTSGELRDAPMVHLFGCTEPQLIKASENDENGTIIPIPVIVAIVSTMPPPSVVGIKSIQRSEEEIVPMESLRLFWNPRPANNASKRHAPAPKLHVLTCLERRARLKIKGEAAIHKYDYILPYIIRPGDVDREAPDTNVQVLVDDLEGRSNPVMVDFDYEMDDLDEFVEEQLQEQELDPEKHKNALRQAIQAAVHARKLKNKADKNALMARIDEISPEERESIANMKLFKFYPSNDEEEYPDVTGVKSRYINRYYGQADFVR